MRSQPVRLGMVGAGFFGQVAHLRNYAQLPSCELVALAELREDLRNRVADKFAIPQRYSTHLDMLQEANVEAVVVVTSRASIGPIVLDCLNARKHVLSEKPITGTADNARLLCEAARQKSVSYMVGYMKRHDAGVQAAHQLLRDLGASQELGAMTYVRVHCFAGDAYCGENDYERSETPYPLKLREWPIAPAWLKSDSHKNYDRYLNTYCHNINLVRCFLGEPELESAFLRGDFGVAILNCNGVPVLLETGLVDHTGWDEQIQFVFERGWVTVRTPAPLFRDVPASVEVYRGGKVSKFDQLSVNKSWAFRRQAEAFIESIQEDSPTTQFAEEAYRDVQLVETIWRKAVHIGDAGSASNFSSRT